MISLLAPFAAYLPAEALGVSGVLAAVVAGLIAGRARRARPLAGRAADGPRRLGHRHFIINSFAFMLIGLQLPVDPRGPRPATARPADRPAALAISLTVIVARIVWVFPATYLPRRLSKSHPGAGPVPVAGGTCSSSRGPGMRGAVSLAAALALPLDVRFPQRDLVIFLTFCVILATLVGQGLTLPCAHPAAGARRGDRRRTRRRRTPGRRPSTRRSPG